MLRSESLPLKNRSAFVPSFTARLLCGLLIAVATLGITSCSANYYRFPEFNFAGRPIPPSKLANRVMVSVSFNGSQGGLTLLDSLRDIRNNVENTITSFSISGYSGGFPSTIISFPEQLKGYVFSESDGSLAIIDYGKESTAGSAGSYSPRSSSIAVPVSANHIYAAQEAYGGFTITDNITGRSYFLNIPNAYKAFVNTGDTVALVMVRNSNAIYRVIKLNTNQYATAQLANAAIGSIDCQPLNLPVYCAVPVPDSAKGPTFDRPIFAYFSLDGTTAYILNCGPECGGSTSSISLLQQGPLNVDVIPTSPTSASPVTVNVLVPGGATTMISDGSNLYIAGQQLQPDNLFAGFLSTMSLGTNTITGKYSISDGNHTKLLFADDSTLWIGSQFCATGERAKLGQNFNCLTRFDLGTRAAQVLPNVTPGSSDRTKQVPYPNSNQNVYYYGDLTGLCWVQNLHKVYTAYGGQVHAFNTTTGAEINNSQITVQGTALDVAYLDATTNAAN